MLVKDKLATIKTWVQSKPTTLKRGLSVCLAVMLMFGVVSMAVANGACAVEVNGEVVAVVKNKATAETVVNSLIEEHQKQTAKVKALEPIVYKTVETKDNLINEEELKQVLAEKLTFEAIAAGIEINGSLKVALKDKQTAEQVLNQLKQEYQVGSDYQVSYKEKVTVVDVPVDVSKILSTEQAVKRLKGDNGVPRYYTVKEGDTIWDIANAWNVSPEELQETNPGFTPERMQIGQKIKMIGALDPIINVVAITEKTVKEDIVLAQEVRKNSNLPFGKTKLIQQGEKGLKEVTYQIVAVNGLETERKVLDKKILKEAKPQIIERSSQTMVASRGISRPGGAILSPFGTRGGRMHTGVDLSGGYGAPIRAAQDGKVIRAGWNGGYGKCVDISHGNGVVTRYAHMSSFNVSVGQSVSKGQTIGKIGSTGRSTGPHLHFELIVNGAPKNPVGYL